MFFLRLKLERIKEVVEPVNQNGASSRSNEGLAERTPLAKPL
jgi:hypothetical protein